MIEGQCLHCIIGEDRRSVLSETRRILRRGGIFHVASMCGDPTDPDMLRHFDPVSRCLISKNVALRYLGTADSIEKEIIAAGFTIIHQRVLPHRHAKELDLLLMDVR